MEVSGIVRGVRREVAQPLLDEHHANSHRTENGLADPVNVIN